MATDGITKCLGLVTQYNPLSTAPGALVKADNCVVDRENVVENRRGYYNYFNVSNNVNKLMVYSNTIVANNGSVVSYDNGGAPANFTGSYSPISGQKMRFVEGNSNLYVTTSSGVQVFGGLNGSAARLAGAPRSLDPSYVLNAATTGFLTNGNQCAYRVVIQRVDANNNSIFGYPSTRLWVSNSSGNSKNVDLTLYLPSEVTTSDIIQFYRTAQVTGTSSDAAGDEMQLVYQYQPTSTDISNGYFTFTDVITDALRGATLYTSPSQGGIIFANDRPPLCKDIALFRSTFMCYANTSTKQRQFFSLIGTSKLGFQTTGDTTSGSNQLTNLASTSNLVVGMKIYGSAIPASTTVSAIVGTTVTLSQNATATATGVSVTFITQYQMIIAGTTYSFDETENASTGTIAVSVTGIAATDIDLTGRSLVRVINRYATNTSIYAYYTSGPSDTPGMMLFEERGIGGSAYTTQVNNAQIQSQFSASGTMPPVSPATTTQCTSTNQVQKNAIYISNDGQLEGVPTLQYKLAGSANKEILRIAPLRDSVIIVKEDGVYRMTGNAISNFDIAPLDLTVLCKGADSVAVLSNQVFMLSNQGVVAITENGVEVISHEIWPSLKPLLGFANISSLSSGCAYQSDSAYMISLPTVSTDTVQNQTYRYNIFTRTWTRWGFGFNSAIVEPGSDRIFFSKPNSTGVYRERKDFQDSDFADPEYTITISSIDLVKNSVVFMLNGASPSKGWAIVQGTTSIPIGSFTQVQNTFTCIMQQTIPDSWTTGTAMLYPSVGFDIEWHEWSGGESGIGMLKQVSEAALMTDNIPSNNTASAVIFTFRSNFDDVRDEVTLPVGTGGGGWGSTWGAFPWGSSGADCYGYRTFVPRNKQYCHLLNPGAKHYNARERLCITGVSFQFNTISGVIGR